MATKRDHLRGLIRGLVTRMENNKFISYVPRLRDIVQDELLGALKNVILSDDELHEAVVHELRLRGEALSETQTTDSDRYKAAKSVLLSKFDHQTAGFYFREPLVKVGARVAEFMMRSSNIDDVFESDEAIQQFVVDYIKAFRPENLN